MAFSEMYAMNLPLFVPTLDLLLDWHDEYASL
jgi:hypothetical protein